jgi:hypothetical protein
MAATQVSDGQKPVVPVRFPPGLAAATRRAAETDGMSVSAWLRRLVEQEIARRAGRCPACGGAVLPDQPVVSKSSAE